MPVKLRALSALVLLALGLAWAGTAHAQFVYPEGEPRVPKWRAFNAVALGFNPLILGDMVKVWRVVPITKGGNMLTRDANVRAGVMGLASPLLFKAGVFAGISPLVIMDFDFYWNQYIDPVHIRFNSIDDNYAQHIREEKDTYWYWGQNFVSSSTFKMAYKNFIFLDMLDVEYMYMRDVWFSIEFMTIVDDGFHFTNKMFLFYEYEPGWRIGAMWEKFHIFNSDYTRHMINFGFMADKKLPMDMSLLFLTGYHVVNPDFVGLRLWTVLMREWDF